VREVDPYKVTTEAGPATTAATATAVDRAFSRSFLIANVHGEDDVMSNDNIEHCKMQERGRDVIPRNGLTDEAASMPLLPLRQGSLISRSLRFGEKKFPFAGNFTSR
jgi:hypothetical protein